jgi:hypothetical protein
MFVFIKKQFKIPINQRNTNNKNRLFRKATKLLFEILMPEKLFNAVNHKIFKHEY